MRRVVATCQHALDRLLGEALRIFEFLDSHGTSELNICIDDRGADIAGAVALHPAVLCEVEAIQLDAKELNPATSSMT